MPATLAAGREVAAAVMARALCLLWLIVMPIVAMPFPVEAAGLQGTGVVFLHGKGVWTGAFDGGIPAALEAEGAVVASPEMPWSFTRMYGATYDEAMREIDDAVAGLKAKCATAPRMRSSRRARCWPPEKSPVAPGPTGSRACRPSPPRPRRSISACST